MIHEWARAEREVVCTLQVLFQCVCVWPCLYFPSWKEAVLSEISGNWQKSSSTVLRHILYLIEQMKMFRAVGDDRVALTETFSRLGSSWSNRFTSLVRLDAFSLSADVRSASGFIAGHLTTRQCFLFGSFSVLLDVLLSLCPSLLRVSQRGAFVRSFFFSWWDEPNISFYPAALWLVWTHFSKHPSFFLFLDQHCFTLVRSSVFLTCPCPESLAAVPWTFNPWTITTPWSWSIHRDHVDIDLTRVTLMCEKCPVKYVVN